MLATGRLVFNEPPEKKQEIESLEESSQMQSREERKKLNKLVVQTNKPLLKIKTAIPFDPTPDEMTIDVDKVSVVFRQFMGADELRSFPISDIAEMIVSATPFFASVRFAFRPTKTEDLEIKFLDKGDAVMARKLIEGLIVAKDQGIDFSKLDAETIKKHLLQLGRIEQTTY